MTGCTVRRYEQLGTSPKTFEQELRPAVCEHRQTDRLKENYSIDVNYWLINGGNSPLCAIQVLRNTVGVSKCDEKSVSKVYGSMLLELRGGGWVSIFQKKALRNT